MFGSLYEFAKDMGTRLFTSASWDTIAHQTLAAYRALRTHPGRSHGVIGPLRVSPCQRIETDSSPSLDSGPA